MRRFQIPFQRVGLALLGLLFCFWPVLPVVAEPAPAYEAYPLHGALSVRDTLSIAKQDDKISLNLRNASIRDVLNMMAKQGQFNVFLDDSVEGRLTVDIQDVSINKAMEYIFTVGGLTYARDGDTLIVASTQAGKDENLNARVFKTIPVLYKSAAVVAGQLNATIFSVSRAGGSQTAVASHDADSNALLVMGTESDIQLVYRALEKLDMPRNRRVYPVRHSDPLHVARMVAATFFASETPDVPPGALASVVALNAGGMTLVPDAASGTLTVLGTPEQMDLVDAFIREYDSPRPQVAIEVSLVELDAADARRFLPAGSARYGIVTPDAINTVSWESDAKKGGSAGSRLLARPNVVTLDGNTATVNLTEELATYVQNTVTKETAGITMALTPKVLKDGAILLKMNPTIAQPTGPYIIKGEDGGTAASFFLINRRSVDIEAVRLLPGQTLIMGGLLQEQTEYDDLKKMPAMAGLPILGAMFRASGADAARHSELVLMVTAKILDKQPQADYSQYKGESGPIRQKPSHQVLVGKTD